MQWLYLLFAILFEVAGTTSMKFSKGFERWIPSVLMFVFYLLCFTFLNYALKKIDISVAYAIWSGLGIILISTIGILYFHETVDFLKIGCIVLIIIGVVGLKILQ